MECQYKIKIAPVTEYPKYLRRFKDNLSDEILDGYVIFYYNKLGKVVYSKLVYECLDIPTNILITADFFDINLHRKLLDNFPPKKLG